MKEIVVVTRITIGGQQYTAEELGEEKAKEKENSETNRKENCDRGSDHHTTSNSGYFRNVGNWEKFSFWR